MCVCKTETECVRQHDVRILERRGLCCVLVLVVATKARLIDELTGSEARPMLPELNPFSDIPFSDCSRPTHPFHSATAEN